MGGWKEVIELLFAQGGRVRVWSLWPTCGGRSHNQVHDVDSLHISDGFHRTIFVSLFTAKKWHTHALTLIRRLRQVLHPVLDFLCGRIAPILEMGSVWTMILNAKTRAEAI